MKTHPLKDKRVVVRGPGSGVFIGTLESVHSKRGAVLRDVQRIWSWQGALDTATLAAIGPKSAKISPVVAIAIVADSRELFSMSDAASEQFAKFEVWSG